MSRRVVAVAAGSAYRDLGVDQVLQAVVRFLPAPHEMADVVDVHSGELRARQPESPLCALAFAVGRSRHGYHTFVRVYSGSLRKGMKVYSAHDERQLRVGRIARAFADRLSPVATLTAGEIGVVLGLQQAMGDTLSDPAHPMCLASLSLPEPVVRVALEAESPRDLGRLPEALSALVATDPSLRLEANDSSGSLVLAGLGELQIEIALERLENEHEIAVRARPPRVAYQEGITMAHRIKHTLSKQTGGPGMYARIELELAPAPAGAGLVFVDERRGDDMPSRYVEAVRRGVVQAMQCGPMAGHPVSDVHVRLLAGLAHSHDSSELAFETVAAQAFRLAAAAAGPVLLEPIAQATVRADGDYLGDVLGDLARRRAQVIAVDHEAATAVVQARAPLAEMLGYARGLLSLTHGRGSFSLVVDGYEPVPDKLTPKVLAAIA